MQVRSPGPQLHWTWEKTQIRSTVAERVSAAPRVLGLLTMVLLEEILERSWGAPDSPLGCPDRSFGDA